jgi:hypothetical protein
MIRIIVALLTLAMFVGCGTIGGIVDTPSVFPAPDEPDGPKWSYVGKKVVFETEGTDPLDVHEYQWDFGDGIQSDWDDGEEIIDYQYSSPGIYQVKVREQCPLKAFRSPWSEERKITIIERKKATLKFLFSL